MSIEEMEAELLEIRECRKNIYQGGQEFQTRTGRVKWTSLKDLNDREAYLISAISAAKGTNCNVVSLQFGGFN